jgi:hypothetical protein
MMSELYAKKYYPRTTVFSYSKMDSDGLRQVIGHRNKSVAGDWFRLIISRKSTTLQRGLTWRLDLGSRYHPIIRRERNLGSDDFRASDEFELCSFF